MRFAVLALITVMSSWAAGQVAIMIDGQLEPPARYGIGRLEQALAAKGTTVVHPRTGEQSQANFYVLAGLAKGAPQSLSIRRSQYRDKPAVILSGGDARGLMYAALDTADRVRWNTKVEDPFARVREVSEEPYLVERGVSIYTMQRAYFESRLYDEKYWERYFSHQQLHRDLRVRERRVHGAALSVFFQHPGISGSRTGRHYARPAGPQHGGV